VLLLGMPGAGGQNVMENASSAARNVTAQAWPSMCEQKSPRLVAAARTMMIASQ